MAYRFESTVSKGAAKGEPMEAYRDKDGNFILFDPAKRRSGSVHSDDCIRTSSVEEAKRLKELGYSMRMQIRNSPGTSASIVKADRIVVIDLTEEP